MKIKSFIPRARVKIMTTLVLIFLSFTLILSITPARAQVQSSGNRIWNDKIHFEWNERGCISVLKYDDNNNGDPRDDVSRIPGPNWPWGGQFIVITSPSSYWPADYQNMHANGVQSLVSDEGTGKKVTITGNLGNAVFSQEYGLQPGDSYISGDISIEWTNPEGMKSVWYQVKMNNHDYRKVDTIPEQEDTSPGDLDAEFALYDGGADFVLQSAPNQIYVSFKNSVSGWITGLIYDGGNSPFIACQAEDARTDEDILDIAFKFSPWETIQPSYNAQFKLYLDDSNSYEGLESLARARSSPWSDDNNNNIENYLDLSDTEDSLVSYGVLEERIVVAEDYLFEIFGVKIGSKIYLIMPETEEEMIAYTNWMLDHTTKEDYDSVSGSIQDGMVPFNIIIESDQTLLTLIPYFNVIYSLLPADEDNIVRFCGVLSSDDDRTLEELAEIPGELSSATSMFFPSITDSEGMLNINDEELWFKVTKSLEFSPENMLKATIRLGIAAYSLYHPVGEGVSLLQDFISQTAGHIFIDLIADQLYENINDLLSSFDLDDIFAIYKLEDMEGDVDLGFYVDGELVLGSNQDETIYNSEYGDYSGDYSTELMIIKKANLEEENSVVTIAPDDVDHDEEVTLSWMIIENDFVKYSSEENIQIDQDTVVETSYAEYVLPQIGGFEIIVEDGSGNELASVNVKSTSRPGGQSALDGTTDSDGSILFDDIKLGDYTFSASEAGYVSGTGSGKVYAGETTSIIISLEKEVSGGIFGFPIQLLVLGIILVSVFMLMMKKRN